MVTASITRRRAVLGTVGAGALSLARVSMAQIGTAFPVKPIRLVIPFPPAGATDILGRAIGQKLGEVLGQQVVIDNKPGAGGAIGSDAVAKATPDGYTILLATTSTHCIGPILSSKIPYQVERDFTPLAYAANATNVLLVPKETPANTLEEFITYARARPGQLNYGTSGQGTISHLTSEYFARAAGLRLVHIPYKGTALVIPDLIAGQINLIFDSFVSALPHIKSGKVKALGVSSVTRSPLTPEIPTMQEAARGALPGFESGTRFGFYGPAGLPAAIVALLNAQINKTLAMPEVRERLATVGAEPVGGTPEALTRAMQQDREKWSRVVREAGVRVE